MILRAVRSMSTLYSFRNRPMFEGKAGVDGRRNDCHGAAGEDVVVTVPVGTVIRDADTKDLIGDLATEGDELVVAWGGEHGRGNASFTTSRRQAPRICERGLPGEQRTLRLELKLIADVGIIGFPNAGKSSLINRVSAVRAKVADYPFTTITPNLGVVDVDGRTQFVAVDIPGLIEGAHEGKGLGDRFLRHVERTRVFIHMIDLAPQEEGRDPISDYRTIIDELEAYSAGLGERPQVIAGNKTDVADAAGVESAVRRFEEEGLRLWPISVATGAGLRELVARTHHLLQEELDRTPPGGVVPRRRVYRMRAETGFRVEREEDTFVVHGTAVERLVAKLILNSDDALEYLSDTLEKMGVLKELRRQGFSAGHAVRIGEVELELGG